MDLNQYIQEEEERTRKANSIVKDHRIFALDYVSKKVFVRKEAKKIIDTIIRYQQTGIPRNLVIIGSRGSGKTLMVRYQRHNKSTLYS